MLTGELIHWILSLFQVFTMNKLLNVIQPDLSFMYTRSNSLIKEFYYSLFDKGKSEQCGCRKPWPCITSVSKRNNILRDYNNGFLISQKITCGIHMFIKIIFRVLFITVQNYSVIKRASDKCSMMLIFCALYITYKWK